MKRISFKVLIWFLFANIMIISIIPIIFSNGAAEEIESKFGDAPFIDGTIDDSTNEWKKAAKIQHIKLVDLPIKLWVMQTNLELFISIQIDLLREAHDSSEFVGLLISNSSSESKKDFIDAKIIQFSNISADEFNYFDYHINNSVFLNDTVYNGDGAGSLDGTTSIYEFSIPLNKSGNKEDAILNYDMSYAFNITYGETPYYPQGVKKSEIVLIKIKSSPNEEILILDLMLFVLTVIVFSFIGILLSLYVYKIFNLKDKVERLRR